MSALWSSALISIFIIPVLILSRRRVLAELGECEGEHVQNAAAVLRQLTSSIDAFSGVTSSTCVLASFGASGFLGGSRPPSFCVGRESRECSVGESGDAATHECVNVRQKVVRRKVDFPLYAHRVSIVNSTFANLYSRECTSLRGPHDHPASSFPRRGCAAHLQAW